MGYFDSNFSTKSIEQDSPLNSLSMVNGLIVPQDMVTEEEEKSAEYDLEDWELKVAEISGVSISGKSESGRFKLLKVTDSNLEKYYHYLERHLTFPFRASYEDEIGPFSFAEYDVNCIRLDQKIEFEEFYGILIECRQGRKKTILELAAIDVDEEDKNFKLIEDYQAWFWTCR